MIAEVLKMLRASEWKGAGDFVEIAKGKNELVTSWEQAKTQIHRKWRSKRK